MEKAGKLDLLNNKMFQAYVKGLPTIERRILAVSGGPNEEVRYVVSLKEAGAEGPPETSCEPRTGNIET